MENKQEVDPEFICAVCGQEADSLIDNMCEDECYLEFQTIMELQTKALMLKLLKKLLNKAGANFPSD